MAAAAKTFAMGSKTIPSVGYGCWKVPNDACADLVEKVIAAGYRHIDSACDYGNEKEVGEGIRRAINKGICTREELHVTSKLWNTFHKAEHVPLALQRTLDDLGLEYLDLYHIHFPISLRYVPIETRYPPEWIYDTESAEPKMEIVDVPVQETWRALEEQVAAGKVRNLGVCNFPTHGLRDLFSFAKVKPVCLQVELHPWLQQAKLVRYAQSMGMHVTAFSPLGHGGSYWNPTKSVLYEPIIKEIAKKHGKSEAQVVLRWNLERNVSVIPKSENDGRIRQNIDLFGFQLDQDDMENIKTLDRHERFNDPGVFCEAQFKTFCPIFD